jgi:signal transduction histidine kinase
VREIVGFVMGAAAGAAGALFATSTEGRALIERLKDEARPEAERATTEWEPVLREVSRAVRLAVRELETATVDLRARIGEIAAERPDDEVALAIAQDVPEDVAGPAEAVTAATAPAAVPAVAAALDTADAPADPGAAPAHAPEAPAPTT